MARSRDYRLYRTLMVEEAKYLTLHIEPVMSVRLHVNRNAGTCVRVTEGALPFIDLWLHHSRTLPSAH